MGKVTPFVAPPAQDDSIKASGLALPVLWDRYLQLEAPSLSPSRQKSVLQTRELTRTLGDFPSVMFVKKWRWEYLDQRYPDSSTPMLHIWNLQRVYAWGSLCGVSAGNPVALCKFRAIKRPVKAIRNFAGAWPQILAAAGSDRERGFLGVLRYCGPRLEAALALTKEDVIPEGKGYAVAFNGARLAGSWEVKPQKGGEKSNRIIPARPELVPLLRRVLGLGPAVVRVGLGGAEEKTVPFLFPFNPGGLRRLRVRLYHELPLFFGPRNAYHVLRHSFASEIHEAGVAKDDVQKILGHCDPKTTDAYLTGLLGLRVPSDVFAGLAPHPTKGGTKLNRFRGSKS